MSALRRALLGSVFVMASMASVSAAKAADEGHVHIIPEIMDYIASTGSIFRTGEEYLTGLIERGMITREKAENILEKYPEFAFSLLFDNEEEMQKFLTAGNAEWFQAAVPIFTSLKNCSFVGRY